MRSSSVGEGGEPPVGTVTACSSALRAVVVDDAQVHGRRAAVVRDAARPRAAPRSAPGRPCAGTRGGRRPRSRAHGMHQPLQWNIGSVHRCTVLALMPRLERDAERAQVCAAMGVDRALRRARGARRVVDRDRVVLVAVPVAERLRVRRRRAGPRTGRPARPCRRPARRSTSQPSISPVSSWSTISELRLAVGDDVVDLVLAQAGVDRDDDRARGGDAEVGLEDRRGVRAQHGDAVAALDAPWRAAPTASRPARSASSAYVYRRSPWTTASRSAMTVALWCRKLSGLSSMR